MTSLIDTERRPQQPLDKAASSILTDRSLSSRCASWQQCSNCSSWIQEEEIEYIFRCVPGKSADSIPTICFELKTRYPAYTCSSCCEASTPPLLAVPGGSQDLSSDEGAEQLCPLHVQAVYLLQGSNTASNMTCITKGFIVHCPDCGLMSNMTSSQQQVKAFIKQHVSNSRSCTALKRALAARAFDNPLAFGSTDGSRPVVAEKVIRELLSRLVVMTACHIVSHTRPPPTPTEQLSGAARAAAVATAGLKTKGADSTSSEGQQLMPYRSWAVDALSLDSDLLSEANWVRPSLAGMALEHKPSLLDLILAPPYIAVAEHDAGMTADKLAVLLLREQQRQQYGSLASLAAAAAAGEQLPAAVAATETALANLLAIDSVFQHYPAQDRVQEFLGMAGIPGIGDVVYALAQPHVHGRSARYLNVCAVCGMSPAALKRAKRSYALYRCRCCIICTCQSCKQEQQRLQPPPFTLDAVTAAEQLCLWCQGHPDALLLEVPVRGRPKQSQSASAGAPADVGLAAEALEIKGDHSIQAIQPRSASPISADDYNDGFTTLQPFVPGVQLKPSARILRVKGIDAFDFDCDPDDIGRPPQHYDLAIELATAAAAAAARGQATRLPQSQPSAGAVQEQPTPKTGSEDSQQQHVHSAIALELAAAEDHAAAAANARLTKELDQLQQMRQELIRLLGGQELLPAIDTPLTEQQFGTAEQQQTGDKRPADSAEADTASRKRQRQEEQQKQQDSLSAGNASAAVAKKVPKRGRPRVPRCGTCISCRNPSDKRSCLVNRQRLAEGKPPVLPSAASDPKVDPADGTKRQQLSVKHVVGAQTPSLSGYAAGESDVGAPTPKSAEAADVLTSLLLSAAGFEVTKSLPASEDLDDDDGIMNDATVSAADVPGPTDLSNARLCAPEQQQEQQQQAVAEAEAMPAASEQQCLVDDVPLVMSVHGQEQPQPSDHALVAAHNPAAESAPPTATAALLQSLSMGLERLQQEMQKGADATDACRTEAVRTVQLMVELKQQLAGSYEQTGQQHFATGLSVLWKILASFQSLDTLASKVALACNLLMAMPASSCPDNQSCSVVELLLCCWFKEVQDTGFSVVEGHVAAAAVEGLGADYVKMVSGLCHQTLLAITQLSVAHIQQENASAGVDAADGNTVASNDVKQAVVQVTSGSSLLLLHWPEPPGNAWHTASVKWRQCLDKVVGAAGDAEVVRALQDVEQCHNQLHSMVHG